MPPGDPESAPAHHNVGVTTQPNPRNPWPERPPTLLMIGDINVTSDGVTTPSGSISLKNAEWREVDRTTVTQEIPNWAIVCAILFAVFCLLGLLFLLVKEEVPKGFVEVTVDGDGISYTTYVPVNTQAQLTNVIEQVNYAQWLGTSQAPA